MALEMEIETLRRRSAELKQHAGKFVLIHGDEIVDYFGSYDDAIRAGYRQFRLEPFLVKRILSLEERHYVSRMAIPCRVPFRD